MTIIHPLDSLLYGLFPEAKGDVGKLIEAAKRFYSFGPFEPVVSIADSMLIVEVNTGRTGQQKTGMIKFYRFASAASLPRPKRMFIS